VTGTLAIDDNDLMPETCQMLGHDRTGNPRSDDKNFATKVRIKSLTPQPLQADKPRRPAATQVALFGRTLVKHLAGNTWLLRWC